MLPVPRFHEESVSLASAGQHGPEVIASGLMFESEKVDLLPYQTFLVFRKP